MYSIVVSTKLDNDTAEWLQQQVDSTKMSRAELVRIMVMHYKTNVGNVDKPSSSTLDKDKPSMVKPKNDVPKPTKPSIVEPSEEPPLKFEPSEEQLVRYRQYLVTRNKNNKAVTIWEFLGIAPPAATKN